MQLAKKDNHRLTVANAKLPDQSTYLGLAVNWSTKYDCDFSACWSVVDAHYLEVD